mmetsp:Transcript_22901/g.37686  ORF Transcript_22901/g.37686 Transcript_22901/m.37686 type:complete len:448 (+) Transcript_22901:159-1502(+)
MGVQTRFIAIVVVASLTALAINGQSPDICRLDSAQDGGLKTSPNISCGCNTSPSNPYTVVIRVADDGCSYGVCGRPAIGMYATAGLTSGDMIRYTQPNDCDNVTENCFEVHAAAYNVTFNVPAPGLYYWRTTIIFTDETGGLYGDGVGYWALGTFTVGTGCYSGAQPSTLPGVVRSPSRTPLRPTPTPLKPTPTRSRAATPIPATPVPTTCRLDSAQDQGLAAHNYISCRCNPGAAGPYVVVLRMANSGCLDGDYCGSPALAMFAYAGLVPYNGIQYAQPNGCGNAPENCFDAHTGAYSVTFNVSAPAKYYWSVYITFSSPYDESGVTFNAFGAFTVGQGCSGAPPATPTPSPLKPSPTRSRTATRSRSPTPTRTRTSSRTPSASRSKSPPTRTRTYSRSASKPRPTNTKTSTRSPSARRSSSYYPIRGSATVSVKPISTSTLQVVA